LLVNYFPHQPTPSQQKAIATLENLIQTRLPKSALVLLGYAGTGKTTLISSFVNYLTAFNYNVFLMAPTGRAAKVMSVYSHQTAYTIHKSIYFQTNQNGQVLFTLQKNKLSNAFFIVDEASMIADSGGLGGSFANKGASLLDDLIQFVYSGNNCKLILVGDVAQLPPVGTFRSNALNPDFLNYKYKLYCDCVELTDITRQSLESGILYNATLVRSFIHKNKEYPKLVTSKFKDVKVLKGFEIEEQLQLSYQNKGLANTIILSRSNKQANGLNQFIRNSILFKEEEVSAGDQLMVVKNNYFWLAEDGKMDFIANGQMIEVCKVANYEEKYGFRFANCSIILPENPDLQFEVKILLNTLYSESPALTTDENKLLYETVLADYEHIKNREERQKELKKNPYFNALQVKFGYAITCHKAQGGQWSDVFIDQGYFVEDMLDESYIRWMYTALTRAQNNLFFIQIHPNFIAEKELN
jgi:ATP-dependent exoDNAse (exonuclease V) alpha subunit